jgi:chloramphenicol-sensitive protein RarD
MAEQGRRSESSAGLGSAALAYLAWGLLPLYWKALAHVTPGEILCHRIIWSALFVALLLSLQRKWPDVRAALTGRRRGLLLASGLLIGINWLIYIWAVNAGRVIEASLGYFMNPLINVLLGYLFLGERLRRAQTLAILLAGLGVVNEIAAVGHVPWVALVLAFSFGLYGLVRKAMPAGPLPGLFIETAMLTLPATLWLARLQASGTGALGRADTLTHVLLLASGVVTSLPLLAFAYGVRRLRLVTIGLLQYVSPTSMFLLGVFLFREPIPPSRPVTFALIWIGVLCYSIEMLVFLRRRVLPRTEPAR